MTPTSSLKLVSLDAANVYSAKLAWARIRAFRTGIPTAPSIQSDSCAAICGLQVEQAEQAGDVSETGKGTKTLPFSCVPSCNQRVFDEIVDR
jgi:hypothetical protein